MFYYKSVVLKPNILIRLLTQSTYFLARVFNSTLLNVLSHLRLWRCYLICFTASQRQFKLSSNRLIKSLNGSGEQKLSGNDAEGQNQM
ncbi:unnamed protein product [Meloidogyne enterolobii]|uniref:Uncharacterized protein n=1 Tax=Meloidogyne enterolobii TaxID=390850 RepID=A0ACB0Z690_MELEN